MRRVIVNSTPLIVLCNVGRLHLLKHLYQEIFIPHAVFDEVTAKPDSACQQVRDNLDWIHVERIQDTMQKRMYQAKLHDGEVEVMILAQQKPPADLVILDDGAAKRTAKFLGLTVTGTLGVLLKAKRTGLIPSVAPVLRDLQSNGFYVTKNVRDMVLASAGEAQRRK